MCTVRSGVATLQDEAVAVIDPVSRDVIASAASELDREEDDEYAAMHTDGGAPKVIKKDDLDTLGQPVIGTVDVQALGDGAADSIRPLTEAPRRTMCTHRLPCILSWPDGARGGGR